MIETFQQFLQAVPYKDILSQERAEQFYSLGFSMYNSRNTKEAAEVFEVLCGQRPLESKYWFALASSLQEEAEYERALHAWAMAAILKEEDPYPHFHAAECLLSLKLKDEAKKALNGAAERAKKPHPLKDKISLLREQWSIS